MPSQKPPLSQANSSISLSSWPLIKYSYSVSPVSSSNQPLWTHFPHRDNVFLVIDTQNVSGYIQGDGRFTDKQTRLKIIWGLETLESLDLRNPTQQDTPTHCSQQLDKPAFIALGRSPSLAIKYYKAEDQAIRRFQIKFLSDTAYQSASEVFERVNCPIGVPPISRGDIRYEKSSQVQLYPLIPLIHNVQVLRTPPSTSGYLSESASSSSPTTLPRDSPSLENQYSYINGVSQNFTTNLAPTSTTTTIIPTCVTSGDLYQKNNSQPVPPQSHFSHSFLPHVATPSSIVLEEDIPPPRPPPAVGSRKQIESQSVASSKRDTVDLISSLTPLPKPTLLSKPPPGSLSNGYLPTYHGSSFDSSRSISSTNNLYWEGNRNPDKKGWAGIHRPGFPGITEEYIKGDNSNDCGSLPIFLRDYKELESEPYTSPPSTFHSRQKSSIGIATIKNTRDTNIGGKRKHGDEDKEKQEQQKKQKKAHPRLHGVEEFRQIEDFIVNAIHDDDFLKFVERIGCVWQRMGFDEVGQNFFGSGVSDG